MHGKTIFAVRGLRLALAAAVVSVIGSARGDDFDMNLPDDVTRPWVGPEYWSSPLMDWQISDGRLESVVGGRVHDVSLLTHQLGKEDGDLRMEVRLGEMKDHSKEKATGWAGFKFAVTGPMPEEYRSALWKGRGINAGVTTKGRLFIGKMFSDATIDVAHLEDLRLVLEAACKGNKAAVTLLAFAGDGKEPLAKFEAGVNKDPLMGNIAIACEPLPQAGGGGGKGKGKGKRGGGPAGFFKFWFDDWKVSGSKVEEHAGQTWGPILWSQYTVNRGVMKMTAHLAPIGETEDQTVRLELADGNGGWKEAVSTKMDPLSRTAHFRIEDWDAAKAVDYRVVYRDAQWDGTIRRDPGDQDVVRLAALSCMVDFAFPNQYIAQNVIAQDPDLVFFAGDQIYESVAGYGVVRARTEEDVPRATLNYLPKYWLFGWSFRDLLKDRPSVIIPDDHDVYHGNIWGKGGEIMPEGGSTSSTGGYQMHPTWVNMIQRTQVSHLPDPHDSTPAKNGISVYYTNLDWGGVSFAILEDRKFKSAPGDVLEQPVEGSRRVDHVTGPGVDTAALDKEGLTLLGERQLSFLEHWAEQEWSDVHLKAVLSQSPYCAVATNHGGGKENNYLQADLDANGWPQTPRRNAVETIRKAHAVMIHGDQHLATLVHHGTDDWGDSGWSYAAPGIANGYPRIWRPLEPGKNPQPGAPFYTGDFLDGFGNKITVWAAANREDHFNPDYKPKDGTILERLQDNASGYGIIAFDKPNLEVTVESWPVIEGLTGPGAGEQMAGWPKTLLVDDFYAKQPVAWLPMLLIKGQGKDDRPLVRVYREEDGSLVYARRIAGTGFRPKVFAPGKYTLMVGDGGEDDHKFTGLEASTRGGDKPLEVEW